jgi:hypothetical protein
MSREPHATASLGPRPSESARAHRDDAARARIYVDTSGLATVRQRRRREPRMGPSRAFERRRGAATRLCRGCLRSLKRAVTPPRRRSCAGSCRSRQITRQPQTLHHPAPRFNTIVHRLPIADVRAAPPDEHSARHEARRNRSERLPVASTACSGVSVEATAARLLNFSTSQRFTSSFARCCSP